MDWIRVHDWEDWQTLRKDRPVSFIKVHTRLLQNWKWVSLSEAERGVLVSVWLIASERNGYVPNDPKMLARLAMLPAETALNFLWDQGFLDNQTVAKKPKIGRQMVRLEKEKEVEIEIEKEKEKKRAPQAARSTICKDDWLPSESTINTLLNDGYTKRQIWDGLVEMRDWSQSGAKRKADWNATLRNWVRRNAKAARPKGSISGQEKRRAIAEVIEEYEQSERSTVCGNGSLAISPPTERRSGNDETDGEATDGNLLSQTPRPT